MVCKWGMSERLGPVDYSDSEERLFLGGEISRSRSHSDATALEIDKEVRRILEECESEARKVIEENRDKLEALTEALLQRETLDASEVDAIFRGEELPPRANGTEAPEPAAESKPGLNLEEAPAGEGAPGDAGSEPDRPAEE
jgi:cell division protease FtsH